jgi:hypothetical protein
MALGDKDRDKASADLLRRTLVSSGTTAGAESHPDPEILAAYSERALDADETAHYELHFSQCARCRDQLALMVQVARPVGALAQDARPFHWVWPWTWFVLTPVATALLIAAVFIAQRPTAKPAAERPLMAMQQPNQAPMPSTAPEDRAQEGQDKETLPANPSPSSSPSRTFGGATQRKSSDFTSMAQSLKQEPDNSLPEEDKKLRFPQTRAARGSSCSTPLDGSPVPSAWADCNAGTTVSEPAAAKAKGSGQNGDAARIRAQAETATVEPAAPPAPVPQTLTSADAVSGAGGGATAAAAPKQEQPAFVAGVAHNARASNGMVVLEAPLDRGARTLVRSPDPQVLWRISGGRYVERSTNGGATWRAQWTNASAAVVAGSAPSADTCWLVGRGGIVLLTTDGNKWRTIVPPADADFIGVEASSADSVMVTSTDGHKFQTSDGGKHWIPSP